MRLATNRELSYGRGLLNLDVALPVTGHAPWRIVGHFGEAMIARYSEGSILKDL